MDFPKSWKSYHWALVRTFYPIHIERIATRQQLVIGKDTILITYTGKIYKHKLLEQIPAALQMISLAGKQVSVLFVGPVAEDYKQEFEKIMSNQQVPAIYYPSVPPAELRKYYKASYICRWPARATGSTVNTSACGKPIICNQVIREKFSDGNGIGVEAGNKCS